MKKLILILSMALGAAFVSGCASVSVCNQGNDMVVVQNSGCFLFYILPLFSGDPDYPNQQVCNWFDNTVKLETNMRLLDEEARRQGATGLRNVVNHPDDDTLVFLILKRKIIRTSAELVK